MSEAIAIIGAGFGDEGKGNLVSYFADEGTVVVRYNGGAQAGHTVVAPDGKRHVFHHFGSGSLRGAATHLSRFFIVNPFLWQKEQLELELLGLKPEVAIHPLAPLTTPYDMLVNQEIERLRAHTKHGSCGLGINETITRNSKEKYRTLLLDAGKRTKFREQLKAIRADYSLQRYRDLTREVPSVEFLNRLYSDSILESYLDATEELLARCSLQMRIPATKRVVFEGAQGLLLDEFHRFFPHVTRSRPGLSNVLELVRGLENCTLRVIYVTRAYMTRHGAGPFPTEDPKMSYPDATNRPNPFQGTLRFGSLDYGLIAEAIRNDLANAPAASASLAVTCLDQSQDESVIQKLEEVTGLSVGLISRGPTREHVSKIQKMALA